MEGSRLQAAKETGTQQDEGREDGTQTSERNTRVHSRSGKQTSWQAEMGEEAARLVPADCTAMLTADMLVKVVNDLPLPHRVWRETGRGSGSLRAQARY